MGLLALHQSPLHSGNKKKKTMKSKTYIKNKWSEMKYNIQALSTVPIYTHKCISNHKITIIKEESLKMRSQTLEEISVNIPINENLQYVH